MIAHNRSLRRQRAFPPVNDCLLAGGVCVLDVVLFSTVARGDYDLATAVRVMGWAVIGCLPLAWRRVAPRSVFTLLLMHAVTAALWLPGYRPTVGLLVALYTVATLTEVRESVIALIATTAVLAPIAVAQEWADNPEDPRSSTAVYIVLIYAAIAAAAWGIGLWVRLSRGKLDSLDRRRRREASAAALAERRRIARELHDIISHSLSVIVLQAAGARAVQETDPERGAEALTTIEVVGKESMQELRRLLGVLHQSGAVGPESPGDLGHPGIADVPALVESVRATGLSARLSVSGTPIQLDPSVDLSAYRIVQESLTNCVKHSGRNAQVQVTVTWSRGNLRIDVVDDGGAGATGHAGLSTAHGLPGLHERARAVGGHLDAGPLPSGGFRVSASLPTSLSTSGQQS